MVRIDAHQGGKIEGDGQAGLALSKQSAVASIRFGRGGEAGELAHGPQPGSIHVAVDAAGVREFAGQGMGHEGFRATSSKLLDTARKRGTRISNSSSKRVRR